MKKIYIQPVLKERNHAPVLMQSVSGGGTGSGDPTIDPNPDDGNDDNLSKKRNSEGWGTLW